MSSFLTGASLLTHLRMTVSKVLIKGEKRENIRAPMWEAPRRESGGGDLISVTG